MKKLSKMILFIMMISIITIVLCSCGGNTGNLKSTKVTLYGKTYEFPVKGSELLDNGWSVPSNISYTKEFQPQKLTIVGGLKLKHIDGGAIGLSSVCNTDTSPKELNDCFILGFEINNYENNMKSFLGDNAVVFPCGITARSSYDDVVSAFGEPDDKNEQFKFASVQNGSQQKTLSYQYQVSSGATFEFSFNNEDNSICGMKIEAKSPFED